MTKTRYRAGLQSTCRTRSLYDEDCKLIASVELTEKPYHTETEMNQTRLANALNPGFSTLKLQLACLQPVI